MTAAQFRQPSIRFLLLLAIGLLLIVIMVIGAIALYTLNSAEERLGTFHDQTLSEVSNALELSRGASKLAASAPFLMTLSPSFQLESEAEEILETLEYIESLGAGDPALANSLGRIRAAITDLVRVMAPQTEYATTLSLIDRDLERLQRRFRRLTQLPDQPPGMRQGWSSLQQLVMAAIGALRTEELIKIGEHQGQYRRIRQEIGASPSEDLAAALTDVEQAVRQRGDLFSLRFFRAGLDAGCGKRPVPHPHGSRPGKHLCRCEGGRRQAQTAGFPRQDGHQPHIRQIRHRRPHGDQHDRGRGLRAVRLPLRRRQSTQDHRGHEASCRRRPEGAPAEKKPASSDEIGQLSEAFRTFRANALRLNRKTKEIWRRNELFITVFQNISDGVAVLSPTGQIIAENGRVRELLRLEPPRRDGRLTLPQLIELSPFERRANEDDRAGFGEYMDPTGRVLEVRQSALPDGGSVWLFSETTERKRIDERLEEIRRVESLGKVTGEVAHDFGNILSTISGNLHMLEDELSPRGSAMRARINDAVELGVSLIERLLAFARKQHLAPQETDIAGIVEGMEDLLSMALPETVCLTIKCDDGPMHARIDPGQLESAILNLCVNAGQAITGDGHIEISVSRQKDGMIALSVQDNGCGMDADTLRQAAEPFFTARADGEGTGLGLSMVHGFVHQSGGTIHIASQPSRGTRVTLTFPACDGIRETSHLVSSRGHALVVDDDPKSAKAISDLLEKNSALKWPRPIRSAKPRPASGAISLSMPL
ncbi:ATP-binding protein [Roseibium salinum]|nr:ATP-binding protein [Roseibium salinum]